MKKLNFLIIIGVLAIASIAKAGVPDYVISENEIKFYDKVRFGLTSSLVGVEETGRVRYNANEVVAYRKNGRIYEKVPVIQNNKETGRYTFMELLAYRNGMKVYRERLQGGLSNPEYDYFVYREGEFVVKFDERNSRTLSDFFFHTGLVASGADK